MLRHTVERIHKPFLLDLTRFLIGAHNYRLNVGASLCTKKDDSSSSSDSSDSDSDSEKGGPLSKDLKSAVESVARAVPSHGKQMESDLLQRLKSVAKQSQPQTADTSHEMAARVSEMLSSMMVSKRGVGPESKRRQQELEGNGDIRQQMQTGGRKQPSKEVSKRIMQSLQSKEKVKLFDGPGLGIFTADALPATPDQEISLWDIVHQEQLQALTRMPPINAFDEMIQWTQEGKLWHFPINNEQGMDEEAKVEFHEHVFLEKQIQDFPQRGPIRHFMELVLVGLSKNPFFTVKQKHEHIDWFRQYFKDKQSILEDALGKDGVIGSTNEN